MLDTTDPFPWPMGPHYKGPIMQEVFHDMKFEHLCFYFIFPVGLFKFMWAFFILYKHLIFQPYQMKQCSK